MKTIVFAFVSLMAGASYGFTFSDSTYALTIPDSFSVEDPSRHGHFVYKDKVSKRVFAQVDIKTRRTTSFDFNVNFCRMNIEGFESEAKAKGIAYQLLADSESKIGSNAAHRFEYILGENKVSIEIIAHEQGAVLISMSASTRKIGNVGTTEVFDQMVQSYQTAK